MADEALTSVVADVLVEWTQEFIDDMTADLQATVRSKSNALAQSITPDYIITGDGVQMNLWLNDYYEFVDKGVSGLLKPIAGSEGRFKHAKPSRKHVQAIFEWIPMASVIIPAGKGSQDQRRRSLAWAIATNIKKRGLKGNNFFSGNLTQERIDRLNTMLAEKIGQNITARLLSDL